MSLSLALPGLLRHGHRLLFTSLYTHTFTLSLSQGYTQVFVIAHVHILYLCYHNTVSVSVERAPCSMTEMALRLEKCLFDWVVDAHVRIATAHMYTQPHYQLGLLQ